MHTLPETNLNMIGGKGQKLFELQLAGFPVPEFVCSPVSAGEAIRILGTPLAVRSSASLEDGSDTSFAGQFRSFLNLTTEAEVAQATIECRKSLHARSVIEYCHRNGIVPEAVRMGVIIQRMVKPELAGVIFTVNPATGKEEVVIEACEGLSNELLAGRRSALTPGHPLLKRYAGEITRMARAVQRHFGAPQDIEFAIENGKLYILQARAITRIQFASEIGEWTNADFRDGGVSCTVCTPLMWSLYSFIWEDALKGFLSDIKLMNGDFQAGTMFFGRPYWNLGAVKECLSQLPGFDECEFDRDLGVQRRNDSQKRKTPVTLKGILKALPTVLSVWSVWRNQERFDRSFLDQGFKKLFELYEYASRTSEENFKELILHAYRETETNYFRTIFCVSLAKLDFMKSFPDADYPALASALAPLKHLDPTNMLRLMQDRGDWDAAFFKRHFAHHSRRELDIRTPRWDEDDEWLAEIVKNHAVTTGVDPRPAFEKARAGFRSRLPWYKRRKFDRKLYRLRTFLWLREEMRDVSSRMYHLIRQFVLAIAEKRNLGDDIFFMRFQEILVDDRSRVRSGRACYESFRNFKAPNEIGSRFSYSRNPPTGALTGIAASRGTVHGVARVACCIEEAMKVGKGEILVCPFTDPGWTPVLDRVAGVVTETGGLLSHAAVICREYGIPAVLGVADATQRIPDGTFIMVSGDQGFVEIAEGKKELVNQPPTQRSPIRTERKVT